MKGLVEYERQVRNIGTERGGSREGEMGEEEPGPAREVLVVSVSNKTAGRRR